MGLPILIIQVGYLWSQSTKHKIQIRQYSKTYINYLFDDHALNPFNICELHISSNVNVQWYLLDQLLICTFQGKDSLM